MKPFYCGTQFADWQCSNCGNCRKYSFAIDPATGKTREPLDDSSVCPIELALYRAGYGDGSVSNDIAKRMGYTDYSGRHCWPCSEIEPVTAEIAEAVSAFRAKYPAEDANG